MNNLELVSKTLEELDLLDDFCKNWCNVLCKNHERYSKDKCNVKDFINYISRKVK